MSSPTSRTLDLLRKEGWTAQVVEKRLPFPKHVTIDLFGGIDVLACRPRETIAEGAVHSAGGTQSESIVGIQACAGPSHSVRKAKLLNEKRMAIWLAAGGRLEIWSWSKRGARGKRKTWTARREPLSLSDFIPLKETVPNVPRGTIRGECG